MIIFLLKIWLLNVDTKYDYYYEKVERWNKYFPYVSAAKKDRWVRKANWYASFGELLNNYICELEDKKSSRRKSMSLTEWERVEHYIPSVWDEGIKNETETKSQQFINNFNSDDPIEYYW